MKKIFNFAKKKKGFSPNSSDTGSVLSVGYEIKEKDLSKLHKAASLGDLAKLKQLAKKNDLSQLDKENRTPLHIACANGHAEVVQFLVESKAKLNLCDNHNRSPLMKAVQCQQERCAVTLLEHDADPNLVDINGNTALHLAALIPSISLAVQLLEHEANINTKNKDGCTPLTLAVTENHAEMAEFLLKEGADVNAKDQGERTSLMIAACNGQISMVRLLLRYNADIAIKDEKGWTADDYAVMNGHHACSHLIIEHGTKGKTQPSPSYLAPGRKKQAAILGSPGHRVEVGPALGGPATDREVDEDDSQAESISRASKRGAGDSWPSSDEDDELDFSPKKPQKPNLKNLLSASHTGRTDVIADVNRSWSECQSEQESEGGPKRNPSLPMALPPTSTSPNPASPSPTSFYKPPQVTFTPPNRSIKGGLSEAASTSKPRGDLQEEEGSDSPEGQEEEESEDEDEEAEEDDDDEDDEDQDEEEEEEEDDDDDIVADEDEGVACVSTAGITGEEMPRPGTVEKAEADAKADVEEVNVDQSARGLERAVLAGGQEAMENIFHTEHRNDDDEDKIVSKNRISEANNGIPVILDFVEDYVVSAIRVESRFSDEEEADGSEEICDRDHDVSELRSPPKPKTLLLQNMAMKLLVGNVEKPNSPDLSWGDEKDENNISHHKYDDLEADSPEEPKKLPQKTGIPLLGKKADEPTSPDVLWGDENENISNHEELMRNRPPVLTEPQKTLFQQNIDEALLGEEIDEPTSPVDSWRDKRDVGDIVSDHDDDQSGILPQQNVGTKLLCKKTDEPTSPEVSWGDEKDEVDEDSDHNSEALERRSPEMCEQKPLLLLGKMIVEHKATTDSWGSDETNVKSEHTQPAEDIAEKRDSDVPVSLIVGHYKGSYEAGEDSGKDANDLDEEVQGKEDFKDEGNRDDLEDELFHYDQIPQTDIDDVELDPPVEEDPPYIHKCVLSVRDTEDKQVISLNVPKPGTSKDKDSTEEDDDDDDDDDDYEVTKEDEEEEEDGGEVDNIKHDQDYRRSYNPADVPQQKSESSKNVKRDFLSELGLEGGEEEDSPWDSESGSDSPGKQQGAGHSPVKTHKVMASISEENNEEPRDDGLEKKPVLKVQPASILLKPAEPKEDADKKADLMEELGLGDADDLEESQRRPTDASDWDTASTTSRTIPGRKLACPLEEEPRQTSPVPAQPASLSKEQASSTPPLPSPRSSTPLSSLHPQPQPRAKKPLPVNAESEEESDWDSESVTPASSPGKTVKPKPNIPEKKAISKPDIPSRPHHLSPEDGGSEGSIEPEEEPHKEKDALDASELNVRNITGESETQVAPEEDGSGVGGTASMAWEKRYEKIWVEIEKREVKSHFKSVTAELKERFGETLMEAGQTLMEDRESAPDVSGEEDDKEEEVRTAEQSSEEEEMIRPAARTKNAALLPIPEQRESVTERAENPQSEKTRLHPGTSQDPCHAESSQQGKPDPSADCITDGQENKQRPAGSDLKDDNTALYSDTGNCKEGIAEPNSDEGSAISEPDPVPIPSPSPEPSPSQETKLCTDTLRTCKETEAEMKSPAVVEGDPDTTFAPSLRASTSAPPRFSDEELEEDLHRFQREVGKLRVVFLDLEMEKEQLQKEVGGENKMIISEVQTPGGLWDVGRSSRQSVQESHNVKTHQTSQRPQLMAQHGSEKGNGITPKEHILKTRDAIPQRDLSKSPKSGSMALEQEGDGVNTGERITQRPTARPQHAAHANGDPLSVFDDSTVSEVSDDDGRSAATGILRSKGPIERDMADEFDELTQSSDTPTEDVDSPTSVYRNASLLIQQLDSSSIDMVSMVKMQNMFHEYERTIQRERGRYGLLADKVSQLEEERAELRRALEETRDGRSALERRQVELETDLNNLKFALKQEQEKHRNAAMLYEKSREQLRKKEEQQRAEAEERQRMELSMRNLELEMRALVNNMKQLEEDRSEAQRMLSQERSSRALQEGILSSHLRKQKEIEEENRRNLSKSNDAMSQLSEASDRERELMQQSRCLKEEVTSLQMELERARAHSRQEEGRLSEESEAVRERLEDARRDLKLSEEALAQTVFQYNSQLTTLKTDSSVAVAKLEHERQAREKLEAEAESMRARLASALQEVERSQAARAEAERTVQRERDECQRTQDKRNSEATGQRESIHGLSQRLGKAEAKANSLENECHRSALALTEKTLLLETVEREREQALARLKEQDADLLAEKEQRSKAAARQEALQERLGQAQSENMLLRQQLEEAHSKGVVKERAVTDAQERFGDLLAKLRADSEDRVHMVEERSKELVAKNTELREHVYKHEHEKTEREATLRQLQQELADSLKKLSMSEASLEVNTRYRSDLEEEKLRQQKNMDRLRGKLQENEEQYVQSERRVHSLKSALDDKEREIIASSQKLQEVLSASAGTEKTIKQLEEAVQRLEIDNARLEAAAKQQSNKIEVLQKGAQEAAMVRNRLEGLVTDLQGAKIDLEDQLSREVQKQSLLSHNAQGSHQLWEEELKSRSRLGLRLAELEKDKGELSTQMEIERKKAKKMAEQKKAVDLRLEQEMKRNTDLQKEMYRLRTLVKTAKKKLREQDAGDLASPLSSLRGEMGHRQPETEAAIGRMKSRVDELSLQLEKEGLKCSRLEAVNSELKEQLSSLKTLSKSHERLERSKRQLEEEVSGLRRHMETSIMDQSQADQYRRETEDRARQEIRQKLEEVNLFLQTQAASQEALEQIKAANEASLRGQLEQRIQDLESELGRIRNSQQDSLSQRDSTKTELERYRELYTEEMRLRKSLAAKLERSNERLAEANTRLLSERHRSKSLIASSIVNGNLAGPTLDVGQLGSVGAYGAMLGPLNRSLSLGGSFLSPVGEGHNSRVEVYLAKMQNELEKKISKELDHAAVELEGGSARLSPVGSAAGSQKTLNVDQDPVARATQQYLEVLKKNYMI